MVRTTTPQTKKGKYEQSMELKKKKILEMHNICIYNILGSLWLWILVIFKKCIGFSAVTILEFWYIILKNIDIH